MYIKKCRDIKRKQIKNLFRNLEKWLSVGQRLALLLLLVVTTWEMSEPQHPTWITGSLTSGSCTRTIDSLNEQSSHLIVSNLHLLNTLAHWIVCVDGESDASSYRRGNGFHRSQLSVGAQTVNVGAVPGTGRHVRYMWQ